MIPVQWLGFTELPKRSANRRAFIKSIGDDRVDAIIFSETQGDVTRFDSFHYVATGRDIRRYHSFGLFDVSGESVTFGPYYEKRQ